MTDYNIGEHFFSEWKLQSEIIKEKLTENWSHRTNYTYLILQTDSIIEGIANAMELKLFNEYYKLDAVLFKDEDLIPDRPINTTWLNRIRIAFEHEHDVKTTYQEISHLLITECDLRVLVTYPLGDGKNELDYYKRLITSSKNPNSTEFLIIFAWISDNIITWAGYKFINGDWDKI